MKWFRPLSHFLLVMFSVLAAMQCGGTSSSDAPPLCGKLGDPCGRAGELNCCGTMTCAETGTCAVVRPGRPSTPSEGEGEPAGSTAGGSGTGAGAGDGSGFGGGFGTDSGSDGGGAVGPDCDAGALETARGACTETCSRLDTCGAMAFAEENQEHSVDSCFNICLSIKCGDSAGVAGMEEMGEMTAMGEMWACVEEVSTSENCSEEQMNACMDMAPME